MRGSPARNVAGLSCANISGQKEKVWHVPDEQRTYPSFGSAKIGVALE